MELEYYKRYCKDIENVENFEKAKADNFKGWDCHHRLETHTSDGDRREVDITRKELVALDMYYNRPTEELIFLTRSEHIILHNHSIERGKKISKTKIGQHHSDETKRKLSISHKGKHLSEETKNKMSKALKGRSFSKEHKNKISEALKGHTISEETKKRISEKSKGNTNTKGRHWYNNGKINVMSKECPEGFVPGRL